MAEHQNSIWKTLERNTDGETKVLTVKTGTVNQNILVYTSPIGACTCVVIAGNIDFPSGTIEKTFIETYIPETNTLDFSPPEKEKSKKAL